jgi:lambda repressor-like predicted transcriptional regulator
MPPSWLDTTRGMTAPPPRPKPASRRAREAEDRAFVRRVDGMLRALGLAPFQREHVAAIVCHESAWGRSALAQCGNLAGMKVKREVADWHRRAYGYALAWVVLDGHAASGDAPRVTYCAFAREEQSLELLLARVLGTAVARPWEARYHETHARLWAGRPDWIDALIDAKYRGGVVAGDPKRRALAIERHHSTAARVRALLATSSR